MIISILNQKGGVGKTTTSINLCASLAIHNKKTLCIDLDPQAHSTYTFNIENPFFTISDILEGNKEFDEDVILRAPVLNENGKIVKGEYIKNLFIVPSTLKLSATSERLYAKEFREEILKQKIKKIKNKFDFIILDGPPTLGVLVSNIICASDMVIIPCDMSLYAVEGMRDLLKKIRVIKRNNKFSSQKVLVTKYDSRNKVSNTHVLTLLKEFAEKESIEIFETRILRNEALNQANMSGKTIFDYDSNSTGATGYLNLSKEVLEYETQKV